MKYLKSLMNVVVICSLGIFVNCETDPPEPPPPGQAASEQLAAGTWAPSTGGVTLNGDPRDEWANFQVTFTTNSAFTGGTYSTTGLPTEENATLVWKSSGSWAFAEDGDDLIVGTVYRDGDLTIPISLNVDVNEDLTAGNLSLSFTVPEDGARVDGFTGSWVFTFDLQ